MPPHPTQSTYTILTPNPFIIYHLYPYQNQAPPQYCSVPAIGFGGPVIRHLEHEHRWCFDFVFNLVVIDLYEEDYFVVNVFPYHHLTAAAGDFLADLLDD